MAFVYNFGLFECYRVKSSLLLEEKQILVGQNNLIRVHILSFLSSLFPSREILTKVGTDIYGKQKLLLKLSPLSKYQQNCRGVIVPLKMQ